MPTASPAIRALVELLTEAYDGPISPSSTWFIDNAPRSGLLGTLDALSAAEASAPPGGAGATVAAHAEHLRWSLALSRAVLGGDSPAADWEQSWAVRAVTAPEWDGLRRGLREQFEALRQELLSRPEVPPERLTEALAVVTHAAYHLGAIRQMVRSLGQVVPE